MNFDCGLASATTTETPSDSDEALLQRALAMSMEQDGGEGSGQQQQAKQPDLGAMTEEEQIAYAMRMSMQESAGGAIH